MGWTFVWLMVVLKVPIAALLYIVWWAVHATDVEPLPGGDGGSGVRPPDRPRGRGPSPRSRGPHGAPFRRAPTPRTRSVAPVRDVSAGRH